jgi:hypothetical protein
MKIKLRIVNMKRQKGRRKKNEKEKNQSLRVETEGKKLREAETGIYSA